MKTFQGNPITLVGEKLQIGDKAPNFKAVTSNLKEVSLSDFNNDYLVLNVVPSLDTQVCDLQTKTINEEVIKNEEIDIRVLTISNDLPFAQSRWKNEEELEGIITLSDYLYHDFGNKYGTLIKENKLLIRAVYVLNNKREIIYYLDVDELTQHLDYDKLLKFINEIPGK